MDVIVKKIHDIANRGVLQLLSDDLPGLPQRGFVDASDGTGK